MWCHQVVSSQHHIQHPATKEQQLAMLLLAAVVVQLVLPLAGGHYRRYHPMQNCPSPTLQLLPARPALER
jgi:hypothetical protein